MAVFGSPLSSGYSVFGPPPPPQQGGNWVKDLAKGVWSFVKGNAGDILQTGAGIAEGIMSSEDRAKAREEDARQFNESLKQREAETAADLAERQSARAQSGSQYDRSTGDTEAQAAVRAQTQLNAAPIADNAQALILARMGVSPGAFKPRDYTQGTDALKGTFTAPGAPGAAAGQQAAANYRPGQGGVDTSALKLLLAKMKGSAFPGQTAPTTSAPPAPRPLPTPQRPPMRMPTSAVPPAPDTTPMSPQSLILRRLGVSV